MEQTRSKAPLVFFAAVIVLSLVAIFLVVSKCSPDTNTPADNTDKTSSTPENDSTNANITLKPGGKHVDDVHTGHTGTPEELVGRISGIAIRANATGDASPLIKLLGQHNLTPAQSHQLSQLAATSRLALDRANPFSPVHGNANRWALNLTDRSQIYLDLTKTDDGQWQVNKITLPGSPPPIATHSGQATTPPAIPDGAQQATATVQGFIDAITRLDPASARKFIDPGKISYARLAALCIIFEEGKYTLPKDKALRKMFLRDTTAGWLARLVATGSGQPATFAINARRKDANSPWKITEINLDKLLADYAARVSGGDIHYTPLIKNPKGGDSLIIYFDLDSNRLTPRTQRQLGIVANLLRADNTKNLTISGHTDALGTDAYNLRLSRKRAEQVMLFLSENGVPQQQMKIIGYGKTKPRPEGRRANRRAEIFLDF